MNLSRLQTNYLCDDDRDILLSPLPLSLSLDLCLFHRPSLSNSLPPPSRRWLIMSPKDEAANSAVAQFQRRIVSATEALTLERRQDISQNNNKTVTT